MGRDMPVTLSVPVNLGPATWGAPAGQPWGWKPKGQIVQVGPTLRRNPVEWTKKRVWSARLFVGLSVNGRPRWSAQSVLQFVKSLGGQEASFIIQDGLWQGVPEGSVQVVFINIPPHEAPAGDFEANMISLAETFASAFEQDLVVLEIQRSGVVVRTHGVVSS